MQGEPIELTIRKETKKGPIRRLRAQGLIPAVCYGSGAEPLLLAVNPIKLRKALSSDKKINTIFTLNVKGDGAPAEPIHALIAEYQEDPLRGELKHVDFVRIQENKPVEVKIPFVLTGKSKGVQMGGRLQQIFRDLPIRCLPQHIPSQIEFDVSELDVGSIVRAGDVVTSEEITLLLPSQQTLAGVSTAKVEVEVVPGAAVEGEAAAETADSEKKPESDAKPSR